MKNLKSSTFRPEPLYSHFDAIFPMVKNYVILVLKKNYDPAIKTPFIAGGPGGVFSTNAKENGEGIINFNPQDEKSFISTIDLKIRAGLSSYSLESDSLTNKALGTLSFMGTKGDQRLGNGVKEVLEETGLIPTKFLDFRLPKITKHGEQNFFVATELFAYCPKAQDFRVANDLDKISNFMTTDPEIVGVRAVKLDEVFDSAEFTIIGNHRQPLQQAVEEYIRHLEKLVQS